LVPSETPYHVLFDCPLHARARWLSFFELQRYCEIAPNMDILTGDYTAVKLRPWEARTWSEYLLLAINAKVPL